MERKLAYSSGKDVMVRHSKTKEIMLYSGMNAKK